MVRELLSACDVPPVLLFSAFCFRTIQRPRQLQHLPRLVLPVLAARDRNNSFSSFHTGGLHFGLADGTVKVLSDNTDQDVLDRLADRADGNIVTLESSPRPTDTDGGR